MATIRDSLQHPAMLVMIDLSDDDGKVILAWQDGGQILVRLDTFLPADETHDGSEEVVFDVLKVLKRAPSVKPFEANPLNQVSTATNLPTAVFSPDPIEDVASSGVDTGFCGGTNAEILRCAQNDKSKGEADTEILTL